MEFGAENDNRSIFDNDLDINNVYPAKTERPESLNIINGLQSTNGSILSTADSGIQCHTNSLASDHIDVDALLRRSSRGGNSLPLATPVEIPESAIRHLVLSAYS